MQWLKIDQIDPIRSLLIDASIISNDERIESIRPAGEGNMNLCVRVKTSKKSVVVKQARPWVEKYPQIPAPVSRHAHEARFYRTISKHSLIAQQMPRVLCEISSQCVLVLEDLGDAQDCSTWYQGSGGQELLTPKLQELSAWLSRLHSVSIPQSQKAGFSNIELRRLNYQHMFEIPFQTDNGIDFDAITPGLQEQATKICQCPNIQDRARQIGQFYLFPPDDLLGQNLLHGDFYPGSWLATDHGLRVIDPEFCFVGPREFDLGVLVAHLRLVCGSRHYDQQLIESYKRQANATVTTLSINRPLLMCFASIEIIRRLIGVAQLPLRWNLDTKTALLESAVADLMDAQIG